MPEQHTPTPWRVGNAGRGVFSPNCGTRTIGDFRRGADTRHAVRCVNGRDKLLRMLEQLIEVHDAPVVHLACASYRWDAARELVEKAKGDFEDDAC